MNRRHAFERRVLVVVGALLAAFLLTPLVALFLTTNGSDFWAGLRHPMVWPALRLSLLTSGVSLVVIVALGTPLAWSLARSSSSAARTIEAALQLPIVIPPAVAGVALLLTFGRRGLLAGWLYPSDWSIALTTTAVILAQVFVAAPFYLQAAISAFRRVDPRLVIVARSFGASPLRIFFRIASPIAASGLIAGAAMSWARALGEFGATLMFAGNLESKTQTLPLAIYTALESDPRAAQSLSIVLVVVAFVLLLLIKLTWRRRAKPEGGDYES